jgi:hypothetical protein
VIVPATESGPNANGSNLLQMFNQGQVATWQASGWNTGGEIPACPEVSATNRPVRPEIGG